MRIPNFAFKPISHSSHSLPSERGRSETIPTPSDRVTLTGRLSRIATKAALGAVIGATATGLGVAGAMVGAPLLGMAAATGLGVGLAHGMKMMVPSTFSAPSQAPAERTFYGATAGFLGGAFGTAMTGLGLLSGGPAVFAAGIAVSYASTLSGVRNAVMEVGEQFPNAL